MASGDNVLVEVFTPGAEVTGKCTALVRGKRFVVPSADITGGIFGTENPRIAECGAGGQAIAVSRYEGANGDEIPIVDEGYVPMPAGAAITVGQKLMSDAQGRPVPWVTAASEANNFLGVACSTQAVVDADVLVKLALK
jgi:hypothetical protein